MHPRAIRFAAIILSVAGAVPFVARHAQAADGVEAAVLVLARGTTDPNLAVRVERDLRNMMLVQHQQKSAMPKLKDVEPRFDVGNLSKGHLSRSQRQFNKAQRAIEKKDFGKAKGHLFRARRFYNRASPYAAKPKLLKGIFYYDYLVAKATGKRDAAKEAYCQYVALSRALAGTAGPLEQFEPLTDTCGRSKAAGTAELSIKANVDGAHVYLDNRPVGVVGRSAPYVNPFIPAGPHLVEVRKAGFVRWGQLISPENGKSLAVRAKLKQARTRVRESDYDPLMNVVLVGKDRFSPEYLNDLLFRMADQYGVQSLVVGYLDQEDSSSSTLTILTFHDQRVQRFTRSVPNDIDGYRPALKAYWTKTFGTKIDPADAQPTAERFAPTLFRVE
ncbi:MAG: PEGA domain-containing protein [Myxococcota bacterium]|nr:PEGA domain-containing protein [Myxococcota bacterium]